MQRGKFKRNCDIFQWKDTQWIWVSSQQGKMVQLTIFIHGQKHLPEVFLLLGRKTHNIRLCLENSYGWPQSKAWACNTDKHMTKIVWADKIQRVIFHLYLEINSVFILYWLYTKYESYKELMLGSNTRHVDKTYIFTLHLLDQRGVWCSCQTEDLLQLINTWTVGFRKPPQALTVQVAIHFAYMT